MSEIRYDYSFNLNEWFIVIALIVGTLMVLWLPRRFSKKTACVYLMCGVFNGFFFDHTLSVFPVSFYDINDTSRFEVMDFFSHVMYAPYSYLFFYLYDFFRVKTSNAMLYILVWAFVSTGFERLCVLVGIFHYQQGYSIYYSFCIYLVVLSLWVTIYHVLKNHGDQRF
ncbi:hypothetical protein ACFPES_31565 [Paenibacillus sp. GCM10023248]|uniref:hypothetical protein n=1 Tax=Bacillales TaxID=1385 RepID=UPI002378803D|nr:MULTISPECIES: hypothetical protein [Bacillales]MDD9271580.1 hypothetical protein [Paenibacillus sp. MAHUQ-63]MDR6884065.1 hypothetical protein [Bacillus sp. 3255]